MTEFESQVLADLSVLKSQMDQMLGIGQPGRLHEIEQRLVQTEVAMHRVRGAVAAFGLLLTVVHLAISYFGGHR